ncbi:hypothetical protein, partial [Vibrio aestuarianus]|uniref:hypothetical protein n=1 Tax=Vibrio aestuarianus TaxID=28171 RepID=UPI00237CD2BE
IFTLVGADEANHFIRPDPAFLLVKTFESNKLAYSKYYFCPFEAPNYLDELFFSLVSETT